MKKFSFLLLIILVGLTFYTLKSQSFFESKDLSFTLSYGPGKIVFYDDYTPRYIGAADQEAVEYSPSFSFKLEKSFLLNERFDISIGLSHITITEKTYQTAKPDWFDFKEKNLSQGFIHLVPSLNIKLPDDRFQFSLGLRIGTASFFGSNLARGTSHSFGSIHADIDSECGVSIMLSKKFSLDAEWIYGLTKYDYLIGTPVALVSYFKYHSFQFGIRYIICHAKKT